MKKTYLFLMAIIGFAIFSFTYFENTIIGRWECKSPNGNVLTAVFKKDHTYTGYANNEVFVTGNYTFKDNLLTMDDEQLCKSSGIYKITFFADSIRFAIVADTCADRKAGTDKLVLGLIKGN